MSEYEDPFLVLELLFDRKVKLPANVNSFEEYFSHPLDGVLSKLFPDVQIGTAIGANRSDSKITIRARLKDSQHASKRFRTEFTYKSLTAVYNLIEKPSSILSKKFTLYNTMDPAIIVDRVDEEIFGHYTYEKNISLIGIHKNIKSADSFIIDEPGNIVKGGLGLLVIKDLDRLELYRNAIKKAEWFNIVLKHFNNEKDVLECQEELIEKGFKENARL